MAAILLSASPAASAQNDAILNTALRYFTSHDAAGVLDRFEAIRPTPVSPAERERVLATLPPDGDVPDADLNAIQRQKLTALRRVLAVHGRESVYVVKVMKVPQAAVALHARAVLLVSASALDLLDPEELQALVAHEIGHEYFWDDYYRARGDDDRSLLRTLELLCDGIAIVTLRRTGTDPRQLTSALEKVIRFNHDRFGTALNEDLYPPLEVRQAFARRLLEWLTAPSAAGATSMQRTAPRLQ